MLLLSTILLSPSGSLSRTRVSLSPLSSINTICTTTLRLKTKQRTSIWRTTSQGLVTLFSFLKHTHLPVVPWATGPVAHFVLPLLLLLIVLLLFLRLLLLVLNEHKLLFVSVHVPLLFPSLKSAQIRPTVSKVGIELIRAVGGKKNICVNTRRLWNLYLLLLNGLCVYVVQSVVDISVSSKTL